MKINQLFITCTSSSIFCVLLLALMFGGCQENKEDVIKAEEVSPWCILGFDTKDRTPQERISMLKELGLKKYGYNKGKGDFTKMVEEFDLAEANDIEITSVFLWLNAKRDTLGQLSPANELLLSNLGKVTYKPAIWVSFSDNFFEDKDQEASELIAMDMIQYIKSRADSLGCKVALYNHHGWFGSPYNQVAILKKLNDPTLTMAYNFHHAHDFVDEFRDVVKMIKPYLSFVNLNGMKDKESQIVTLGEGKDELAMISILLDEGYSGPWGILGHVKTEDVRLVLEANLAGLADLNAQLKK